MSETVNDVKTNATPRLDLKWEGNKRSFRVGKPVALLGSGKDCDIRFGNAAVEDVNGAILFKDGKWQLANDCVENKLWLNGEVLAEGDRRELKEGDCIDLAHREYLIVHFPAEEELASVPAKGKKGLVAALAAVLALVLLAVGFCGGSYLSAKKALADGDYAAAAASAGRVAFLAGDLEQEAWASLTEEKTKAGELETALGAAMEVADAARRDELLTQLLTSAASAGEYDFAEELLDSFADNKTRDMACLALADAVIRKGEDAGRGAALLDQISDKELRIDAYYALGQDLYSFNDTDMAIAVLSGALEDKRVEALYDDCWLRKVNQAMKAEDYAAALSAAEEVIGKTDEAEALCAEVFYAQAKDAMKAEDYAAALEYFRSAGDVEHAAVYTSILDSLLDGFYFSAAETVQKNLGTLPNHPWWSIFKEQMGEPKKFTDVLVQEKVNRLVNDSQGYTLDADGIESINRNETDGLTCRIGPIDPYEDTDKLLMLADGAPELEACGSGTGKVLVVRTQQDYPRGTTYATVDGGLMKYVPTELFPVNFSEVDYIIYLDYDYANAGSGRLTTTQFGVESSSILTSLRVNCVLRVVNMKTGEELYRSAALQGDTQYQVLFATDEWIPSMNPPIGQAFAEAMAAIPR